MGFWDTFNPFAGMSGEEIYHNFRGNTGDNGAGLYASAFKVQVLVRNYNQRTESITALTTSMESAWQGDAGGAARRGAGPLAVEHGLAGDSMTTAETTLGSQFDAYQNAQRTVTEIPPTPDKPSAWDNLTSLGGASRNYENQVTQVDSANDHNVQIMSAYEGESETNASSMPTTYGRITDDYAAVGIERPVPPTPPPTSLPPPNVGSDPGNGNSNNIGNSNIPGSNDSSNSSNNNNSNNNNTTNPNQNQTTNPSDFRPPSTVEPPRLPPGQNPGQNPNNPGMPGMMPPPTFGPNGGGNSSGRGFGPGGGRGFGPGGSGGMGGPGSGGGSGSGGPGSGARGMGSGFGPGGAAAAEGAAGRGGMGGPGGGAGGGGRGGGGMGGGGRRGEGDEDGEHERPSFLVEPDPHDTFGTDEVTAPPVIGE